MTWARAQTFSILMMLTNENQENIDVETEMRRLTRRLLHVFKDNSLSIVLFALFVICISAQSLAGWRLQDEILAAHGQSSVGYWDYLLTGAFREGLASNWQAAVLQLGSLIVLSSFLYQRSAPHSRDPHKAPPEESSGTLFASTGSTAIRCPWCFCCCSCSRLRCLSSSATRLITGTRARGPAADIPHGISAFG